MADAAPAGECYFLSYSRADENFALRFANDLRGRGVGIWIDQLDIRPSEHWDRAIERAVRQCRGLVVLLSPQSVASDNVADEISFAIDSGKSVLPVMIERCTLPLRITRMHLIDATKSYDRALEQCFCELSGGEGKSRRDVGPPAGPCGVADPATIAKAKEQLTPILGPIAAILVDKTAKRAGSVGEFYEQLAEHIEDGGTRESFLGRMAGQRSATAPTVPPAAKPTGTAISAKEIERIASVLTIYLGPIAAAVTRKESAAAPSADDLLERLAAKIPNARERAEFMRRAQSQ
jgi:hypothetical protein